MREDGQQRHPWHPALVHFPIACWTLATLLDVAAPFAATAQWMPYVEPSAVSHLLLWVGLAFALPAAVAGTIDYITLPETSLEIIHRHIAWMGAATTLFLVAAVWRLQTGTFDAAVSWLVLAVEALGTLCLVLGGRAAAAVVFQHLAIERPSNNNAQ